MKCVHRYVYLWRLHIKSSLLSLLEVRRVGEMRRLMQRQEIDLFPLPVRGQYICPSQARKTPEVWLGECEEPQAGTQLNKCHSLLNPGFSTLRSHV